MKISGSIHAPSDMHYTTLQISIADVTNGIHRAEPVHGSVKKWQMQDSPVFCYSCDLGKLPNADSTLSDWITVAHINLDWLVLPRKGKRNLQFSTSILSAESGKELAVATYFIPWDATIKGNGFFGSCLPQTFEPAGLVVVLAYIGVPPLL